MRAWWHSYALLLRWQLLRQRKNLPFLLVMQAVLACGIVVGWSYLIPDIDARSAHYLTTGAVVMSLVMIGMTVAPQNVAFQKVQGVFDYQRSLPVPRMATVAAHSSFWLLIGLPSLGVTVIVATLRFDLSYTPSPLLLVAIPLVAAGAVAIGYGIAHAVQPPLVQPLGNVIMVIALMFAPINYPAERLPDWAAAAHQWLPFQYMAQAIRDTVDVPASGVPWLPFAVVAIWAAAGMTITARVVNRRT